MASAAVRLFSALLTTFGAIFVGFACVRLRFINRQAGEMKAMGFFVGKIAFPLLIFKTVATADLSGLTWSVILACNIAKLGAFLLAFGLCYTLNGNKLLTSTVFAYFVVASNDFAVGFPVIDALYPLSEHPENMKAYMALNAVVVIAIFTPLVLVSLGVGSQDADSQLDRHFFFDVCQTIFLNPMIVMTILGVLWQLCYPGDASAGFPLFLQQFLDVATAPFTMLALFQTGATLKTFKLSIWPFVLVALKVFFCSHFGATMSSFTVPGGNVHKNDFVNFAFLYGSIPTSPAPLIFSDQFCPEESERIATAIILGTIVAAPNMLLSSVLFSGGDDISTLIGGIIEMLDIASLFSVAMLFVFIVIGRRWLLHKPMDLVVCYVFATALYLLSKFLIGQSDCTNPDSTIHRQWMDSVNGGFFLLPTASVMFFAFGQNLCRLLPFLILLWRAMDWPQQGTGVAMIGAGLVSIALGLVSPPETLDELCGLPALSLWRSPAFAVLLLVATIVVFAYPSFKRQPRESGRPLVTSEEGLEPPRAFGFLLTGLSPPQRPHRMPNTAVALGVCLLLRLLIQAVNDVVVALLGIEALEEVPAINQMLILDTLLEHSQAMLLLVLVLCDADFKPLVDRVFHHWSRDAGIEELQPDEAKHLYEQIEPRLASSLQPRRLLCWRYGPCVRGDEVVDALLEKEMAQDREQAFEVAMSLIKHHFLSQVDGHNEQFQDADTAWYYTKKDQAEIAKQNARSKRRKTLSIDATHHHASAAEETTEEVAATSTSLQPIAKSRKSIKEIIQSTA